MPTIFVEAISPKVVVMKNVLGFLAMETDEVYGEFRSQLEKPKFVTTSLMLNVGDYGVARQRERRVLIGARNGKCAFILPSDTKVTAPDVIFD